MQRGSPREVGIAHVDARSCVRPDQRDQRRPGKSDDDDLHTLATGVPPRKNGGKAQPDQGHRGEGSTEQRQADPDPRPPTAPAPEVAPGEHEEERG